MFTALEAHFSGIARWSRPEGGIFVWVELNEEIDTTAIFPEAVEEKVAYIPGGVFSTTGGHRNTMRLSYANLSPEQIDAGVARLAGVIRSRME